MREVMKQMLEAWKLIPDVSGDFSPPPDSMASSKGILLVFCLPAASHDQRVQDLLNGFNLC